MSRTQYVVAVLGAFSMIANAADQAQFAVQPQAASAATDSTDAQMPDSWAVLSALSGPAAAAIVCKQTTSSYGSVPLKADGQGAAPQHADASQADSSNKDSSDSCVLPTTGDGVSTSPSVKAPPTESPLAIPLLPLLLGGGAAASGTAALAANGAQTPHPNSPF